MPILTELAVGLGRVVASQIKGSANAILYSLRFLEDPNDESAAETSTEEPPYGPLGWYGRPRVPRTPEDATANDPAGECEVIAAKLADRAYPHAFRDLRISAKANPDEGEVGLAHYLGGLLSMKINANGDGTDIVLYAPHQDSGGAPDKAHVLTFNTTTSESNVQLVHSYGQRITLKKDGSVLLFNAAGDAYIGVDDNGITINGNLNIVGGADIGGDGATPGQTVSLSTKVDADINALKSAISGWTPASNDGGAALKTALASWFGTSLSSGSSTVKAAL